MKKQESTENTVQEVALEATVQNAQGNNWCYVKGVQHNKVNGEVMYYLEIRTFEDYMFVNVGKKTYDTVMSMRSKVKAILEKEHGSEG